MQWSVSEWLEETLEAGASVANIALIPCFWATRATEVPVFQSLFHDQTPFCSTPPPARPLCQPNTRFRFHHLHIFNVKSRLYTRQHKTLTPQRP